VLRTGMELLTDRQHARLSAVFAGEKHVQVEATWGIYQRIVAAYRDPDRRAAKAALAKVITSISRGVPDELSELITLGRTLKRRSADVLAYFDRPGTSNGPTEAINGRLEHLRGTALGFRNLTNYITRSLLDTGGFRPQIHPTSAMSPIMRELHVIAPRPLPDKAARERRIRPRSTRPRVARARGRSGSADHRDHTARRREARRPGPRRQPPRPAR